MHNDSVYIIDGVRTALAKPSRGLKKFTAAQLAGAVIKELVGRNKINPSLIAEVALGNTVSAGTGQNFARQSIALAGLPLDIPAYLVNNVCSSDLQSVIIGAQAILSGQAQVFIA
ncbi:MAG: acetyl-CoA C-acyltransferase, partial [Candidatus Omnitrophica bacterium]|nr:acetyl-CoA C-acyltransferase [Candidatus Omnitrophota bacterium]